MVLELACNETNLAYASRSARARADDSPAGTRDARPSHPILAPRTGLRPADRIGKHGQVSLVGENQRLGIHAVPETARRRSIGEDVAQVRVAAGAENLAAKHPETPVLVSDHVFPGDRLEVAGPAGTGFEFVLGREEWKPAADATVHPGPLVVEQGAAERPFGSFAPGNL